MVGNIELIEVFPVAEVTATGAASNYVDIRDYDGTLKFALAADNTSGTNPTLDTKLQTSAGTSTGWEDVTGASFTQVGTVAGAETLAEINCRELNRYVRYYNTVGGTSSPSFLVTGFMAGYKTRS